MKRASMSHKLAMLFGLAAGGCDPAPRGNGDEVAAELRALRLALGRAPATAAAPRDEIAAALAPLREALTGLGAAQRELAACQTALGGEMQRWAQLFGPIVGERRDSEHAALAGRLQHLERRLADQEARHRELETMIERTLDQTADRLEALLRVLWQEESPPPAAVEAPVRRGAADWTWAVVLSAAVLVAGWFALRSSRGEGPAGRAAAPPPAGRPPDPTDRAQPEVQDLWAAAALLGEAVDRLRQTSAAPPAPGMAEHAADQGGDHDEFVLDDGSPAPAGGTAAPETAAAAGAGQRPPPAVTCRLLVRDPASARAEVLRVLGDDPRVLRFPPPEFAADGNQLRVSFGMLPGLPPGERGLLEQRLRDAVA